jgi:hypothetical protein
MFYTESESSFDIIETGLNFMKYAGGLNKDNQFPGGGGIPLHKERVRAFWVDVPKEWVDDGERAVHFAEAEGRVNATDFLGYPAGTMRLEGFTKTKRLLPLVSADDNDLYSYDVMMEFGIFDPPRLTLGSTGGAPDWKLRGHNLVPSARVEEWPNWVPATTSGEPDGEPAFKAYEMRDLFKHHSVAAEYP